MAAVSSPHETRVKTSSQTAVKPSAQSIIILDGVTSLMPVAPDLKLGCFMAITSASIPRNIDLF